MRLIESPFPYVFTKSNGGPFPSQTRDGLIEQDGKSRMHGFVTLVGTRFDHS